MTISIILKNTCFSLLVIQKEDNNLSMLVSSDKNTKVMKKKGAKWLLFKFNINSKFLEAIHST